VWQQRLCLDSHKNLTSVRGRGQRGAMAALQDGRVGEGDDDESMERERLKREAKRTDELVSIIGPVVYLNVVSGAMLWTVRQVSSMQPHCNLDRLMNLEIVIMCTSAGACLASCMMTIAWGQHAERCMHSLFS
jgi:hypothetical protein